MLKSHDRTPINGLSHVKGDESEPLLELTIPALLAATVSKFSNREAAIFSSQNIRWTYAEFAKQVDRLAGGLVALGFKKGCLLYTSPSPRDRG